MPTEMIRKKWSLSWVFGELRDSMTKIADEFKSNALDGAIVQNDNM
jgi:hypothetical protein